MPSKKNWAVVRRLVGYTRFERDALPALNAVYTLAEDYVNFLQPAPKLVEKTRDGPRVRRQSLHVRTGIPVHIIGQLARALSP
jgi:hypothetical protein